MTGSSPNQSAGVPSLKLSELAAELGRVAAELAGWREVAELPAQAVPEREAQRFHELRHLAGLAEQFLSRLESEPPGEATLQQNYLYAHELETALQQAGLIPPTALETREERERAGRLGQRAEAFREAMARAMSGPQRIEAEFCWQSIREDSELVKLIETRTRLEQRLFAVEAELAAQSSDDSRKHLKQALAEKRAALKSRAQLPPAARVLHGLSYLLTFVGLSLLAFGTAGSVVDTGHGAWTGWGWVFLMGLVSIILAVGGAERAEWAANRFKPTEVKRLEQEVYDLGKKLSKVASVATEQATLKDALQKLQPSRYGWKTTEELRQIHAARLKAIRALRGDDDGNKEAAPATPPTETREVRRGLVEVRVSGTPPDNKLAAIKAIRSFFPALDLAEATDVVEGRRIQLLAGVEIEKAEAAKRALERIGCTVVLE